ncbi:hypothetical protein EDC02_6501 [Micromonospora sp. Llam0]|uniref:phosphoribosyltransferase n=1 Tax=Micromonospora sp. Llam0 TaxID=2485143 RepID=UPI000F935803|nr:phosphoribosyltransferase family protein [Micromonospora sp. Llam0]ROO51617.1 hypothetical protein EDC02_6501 [Micromonospora sp. Llam0]
MAAEPPPIALSWPEIDTIVGRLASGARADGTPDAVVGVLRGGLVPAVMVAHALGVRTVRAIEIVHTQSDAVGASKTAEPQVSNPASLGDLAQLDVLVIDDIVGTGATIARTVDLVRAAGAVRIRTAACVANRVNWRGPGRPDQAVSLLGDEVSGWVIFPWETR